MKGRRESGGNKCHFVGELLIGPWKSEPKFSIFMLIHLEKGASMIARNITWEQFQWENFCNSFSLCTSISDISMKRKRKVYMILQIGRANTNLNLEE